MYRLIEKYARDLDNFATHRNGRTVRLSDLPLPDFFRLVANIPYRRDTAPVEVVARPAHVLRYGPQLGADCKKKAITVAAWLKRNKIPFRLMTSSRRADGRIHHVFPQAQIDGPNGPQWVNMDATYRHYRPGQRKRVTNAEVLKP